MIAVGICTCLFEICGERSVGGEQTNSDQRTCLLLYIPPGGGLLIP